MELKLDTTTFEAQQKVFLEEIMQRVRAKLWEEGIKDPDLGELTASIAFSIASVIDDTSMIASEGKPVRPYLTFRGENEEELIHSGENANTYESVPELLNKMFDRKDD